MLAHTRVWDRLPPRRRWRLAYRLYRAQRRDAPRHLSQADAEELAAAWRCHPLGRAIATATAAAPDMRYQLRLGSARRHPRDVGLHLLLFGF